MAVFLQSCFELFETILFFCSDGFPAAVALVFYSQQHYPQRPVSPPFPAASRTRRASSPVLRMIISSGKGPKLKLRRDNSPPGRPQPPAGASASHLRPQHPPPAFLPPLSQPAGTSSGGGGAAGATRAHYNDGSASSASTAALHLYLAPSVPVSAGPPPPRRGASITSSSSSSSSSSSTGATVSSGSGPSAAGAGAASEWNFDNRVTHPEDPRFYHPLTSSISSAKLAMSPSTATLYGHSHGHGPQGGANVGATASAGSGGSGGSGASALALLAAADSARAGAIPGTLQSLSKTRQVEHNS